jgi:two-component system response regulator FixJ
MTTGLVHIIDDDQAFREGLARLITSAGCDACVYASAADFLDALPSAPPGCVVTDLVMPQINGLELIRRLARHTQDFSVVLVTGQAEIPLVVEALKLGASDVIEKPFEPEAMLRAVERGLERVRSAQAREKRRQDYVARLARLSSRERDVLDGLLSGWSNKQIAQALELSPRTIESYRATLMIKTRAESFSELIRIRLLSEPEFP